MPRFCLCVQGFWGASRRRSACKHRSRPQRPAKLRHDEMAARQRRAPHGSRIMISVDAGPMPAARHITWGHHDGRWADRNGARSLTQQVGFAILDEAKPRNGSWTSTLRINDASSSGRASRVTPRQPLPAMRARSAATRSMRTGPCAARTTPTRQPRAKRARRTREKKKKASAVVNALYNGRPRRELP